MNYGNSSDQDIGLRISQSFGSSLTSHMLAFVYLIVVETLGNALLYSVIWYQQCGRESNRTLINHLNSHMLGYMIASNCTNFFIKILPYLTRRASPPWLCLAQEAANMYLNTVGMLTSAEGIFFRYCYLVRWKSIGILDDDFFNSYLFILNNLLSLFGATIAWFGDTLYLPFYFICSGLNPDDIPQKFPNFLIQLVPICSFVNFLCYIKILLHRRKQKVMHQSLITPVHARGYRSTSILNLKSSLAIAVLFFSSVIPFFIFTMNMDLIVQYPSGFLTSLTLPQFVLSLLVPIISYMFNADMREFNWRHLKTELQRLGLLKQSLK